MKANGPRIERETVIVFNDEEETASLWTASAVVYRQMTKRGYSPSQDNGRSASFTIAKADLKLPRPKRKITAEQRRARSDTLKRLRSPLSVAETKARMMDASSCP